MDREPVRGEFARLRWLAGALIAWLIVNVTGGGLAAMALLYAPYDLDSSAYQLVLCATGGAFGAALAALLSVVTLISRGWELADGTRRPVAGDGARFAGRLAPKYAVRPLLGAATGLMAYFLVLGLLVVVLSSDSDMSFEPMGLLSVAILAGFFAQTLLERLRQMFDALFGRTPATTRPADAAATAKSAAADNSGVGEQPQQIGLQGGPAGDEGG